MGTNGTAVTSPKGPSIGLSQSAGPRSDGNECHLFRAPYRLPVEALNATGICSSTSAYRRFREWLDAGVFEEFWRLGLLAADALEEIDWTWLSLDGAMTKAPLGGEKNRPQSYGSRQRRGQAQPAH